MLDSELYSTFYNDTPLQVTDSAGANVTQKWLKDVNPRRHIFCVRHQIEVVILRSLRREE